MTHSAVKGFGKAFLVANNTHFILEKNNLGSYTLILLVLKIIDILQVESQ
jgi:hypothetical protein